MLVNGEEQQRGRLSVQIRKIAALESCVRRKHIGQVEAERQLALKPRLHRMAVSRYDLGRRAAGKCRQMLVEQLGGERIGLMNLTPTKQRYRQHGTRRVLPVC